jgi:hypothetical protein
MELWIAHALASAFCVRFRTYEALTYLEGEVVRGWRHGSFASRQEVGDPCHETKPHDRSPG